MGSPTFQEDGELSNDGDLSDLFVIDSVPTENSDSIDVPVYEKKFGQVLTVKKEAEEDTKPKRPRPPQSSCWNCGGEHSLRECTERKNYNAINRNREKFKSKSNSRGGKASRYHLDDEQKYPHILPGKISRRLRRALGLQSNQLPRHIYVMRSLGYPPGWVEEAKVSHSGLSLFNSDGQEVADQGFEVGEVVVEGAKDKYDIKKIIAYPGFNCPCDPDTIDETERLNSKPMAEKDSIEFMKIMWEPKAVKAYKRRKMNDSSGTPSTSKADKKQSLLLLDDMDLDSDDDNGDSSAEDREVDEMKDQGDLGESATQSDSPQAKKRPGSALSGDEGSKRPKIEAEAADSTESSENSQDPSVNTENVENVSAPTSNADSPTKQICSDNFGKVTSVTLGTPIIVTSPYTHLPSADKFARNICDVINFENLPDSTGKYEKMSGLIKKVRTFVSKLNSEEDED